MKTTTRTWTKHLAALLLSTCLAVALAGPSVALARPSLTGDASARPGGRAAGTAGLYRPAPPTWWPFAWWISLRFAR